MSKSGLGLLALLAAVVAVTVALGSGALPGPRDLPRADGPITDPIPARPIVSGLALTLQEFVTMPRSDPPPTDDPRVQRWARINFLGEVPDRSGRLFVPDLNGKMYFIEGGRPRQYLDVRAEFSPDFWAESGLGSGFGFVTFHPDFARNGRFYTVHTEARGALATKTPTLPAQDRTLVHGVLTEWTAADPAAGTFRGTRREVLRLAFGSHIHGIQEIGFNPGARPGDEDYGLLYVAVGDGGNGVRSDDPQRLGIPQGKILRIDPLGTNGAGGHYGIPPANPFVGRPGALAEIYAYGLRDPYRFSWDPGVDHRMLLGNMGEHAVESIYEVRAGDNFGWGEREGPFVFRREDRCHVYPLPADDQRHGFTYPVAGYDHDPPPGWPCNRDSGHAVIGGYVYRGGGVPELRGSYVFGDGVDGRIFYTDAAGMRRGTPAWPRSTSSCSVTARASRCGCRTWPATPGSICGSAAMGTASSTSCPRRTGRSGRSPALAVFASSPTRGGATCRGPDGACRPWLFSARWWCRRRRHVREPAGRSLIWAGSLAAMLATPR